MKIITEIVCSLSAFAVLSVCALYAQESVSIQSLLKEMVDRDAVARFPETNFRLKQHTSYNRASVSPDDEKGWFANGDFVHELDWIVGEIVKTLRSAGGRG